MSQTVLTGQQIGLLGGPLYTTYKVLGAIHRARQIKGKAIYWLETNDADFNEINHFTYLNENGILKTLTWNIDSQGYSCGYIFVDEKLGVLLEEFFTSIRKTEFTPRLRELVLDCYQSGKTLAEASQQLANELFGHLDIQTFIPFDPEFRKFSRKILLEEAERTPIGQQCNLFCLVDKKRKAIFKGKKEYLFRDGSPVNLSQHDLLPNVKTRNLCQDAYFKTNTYIAGPGEVKYIAQLDPFYDFFGVTKPGIMPRMSITLLEPKVQRLVKKFKLEVTDIMKPSREEFLKNLMAEKSGFDARKVYQQVNEVSDAYLKQLESIGFEISHIKSLRRLLNLEVKKVIGSLRSSQKETHRRFLNDAAYLSDSILPQGKKQDRVFNIIYFMNLYGGKDFIDRIYDNYDPQKAVWEI